MNFLHEEIHNMCLSVRLSVRLAVRPSACLPVCLPVCLSVGLSFRLSVRPSACLSVCLSVCHIFCSLVDAVCCAMRHLRWDLLVSRSSYWTSMPAGARTVSRVAKAAKLTQHINSFAVPEVSLHVYLVLIDIQSMCFCTGFQARRSLRISSSSRRHTLAR